MEVPSLGESRQMTSQQVIDQVGLIQNIMKSVMRQDEHYGVIPGTKKPSLLKPGAEKLCLTFRLAPVYDVERIMLPDGHREYIINAKLIHIPTGRCWGEGLGSCTTLEKKYRYRNSFESTNKPVPKAYWDNNKDQKLIGGKGFVPIKEETGHWVIYKISGQTENPDIAEQFNTILKMATKRALVAATLNACAASDIFSQDIEDDYRHENEIKKDIRNQNAEPNYTVDDLKDEGIKQPEPQPVFGEMTLGQMFEEIKTKLKPKVLNLLTMKFTNTKEAYDFCIHWGWDSEAINIEAEKLPNKLPEVKK